MNSGKVQILAIMLAVGALMACSLGSTGRATPADQNAQSTDSPASEFTAQPSQPPPTDVPVSQGRDFSKIDICQLLPIQDVADMVGGTPDGDPNGSANGDVIDCWYSIVSVQGQLPDLYIAYVEPAVLAEYGFDDTEESVPGIGDRATIMYSDQYQQYELTAIREGDLGVDVIGATREGTLAIAQALMERIPPGP
jgi:hypothetical protein